MAKTEDQDSPVDQTATEPTAPLASQEAPETTTGDRRLSGLALAGIIGGGVATAALLFGGGLAVGVALPDRGPIGFAQAGLPGGPSGMHEGGPGAHHAQPGDRERQEKRD